MSMVAAVVNKKKKKEQAKMKTRRTHEMRVARAKQPMKYATHDSVKGVK